MATWPGVSMRKVCRVLNFSRTRQRARAVAAAAPPRLNEVLAARLERLIELHPTFGYRRLWALLRFAEGIRVNRKAVCRVLRLKGWFVNQRVVTPRPRVQELKSRAQRRNERWATDLTHVPCGADGWGHQTAVIDCNDREITGFEFALLGRAKEAERALEEACLARFGTLRPTGLTLVVQRQWPDLSAGAFAPPAATTGSARSSSRLTLPNRMELSNASFAVSRRSASGSTTLATSPKPELPLLSGFAGTTPNGPIRPSAIAARSSSALVGKWSMVTPIR